VPIWKWLSHAMNDVSDNRPLKKRGRYIVDRKLQLGVTLQLVAVMIAIGVLYIVGVHILPEAVSMEKLSGAQTRAFFSRAALVYFSLATAILATLCLIMTQRVAGPALVIRRTIEAIRQGEFGTRLSLRRADHLQELAMSVRNLRNSLEEREHHRIALVEDLKRCLEEGDLKASYELAAQLGGPAKVDSETWKTEPAEPTEPTESVETAESAR